MPEQGDQPPKGERSDAPEYKVYRSRPRLLDRIRKPDVSGLTERLKHPRGGGKKPAKPTAARGEGPAWRRILKWVALGAVVWILISLAAFAVSAQIQKGKLVDGVSKQLDGNPFMLASAQTILVLGTDVRSGAFAGPDEAEPKVCLEDVISGRPKGKNCKNPPYRSDTMMLIRAGGGSFRKLSIPRDTLAEIPGQGAQKINSAYASGGAKLAMRTVEETFGLDVDQVVIIDFDGFRSFIDTIGGITVDVPKRICTTVSGGAFGLRLNAGENDLDGFQAITLARTRSNNGSTTDENGVPIENGPCRADPPPPPLDDTDRAQFQQLILDGIKGKLTSITSAPLNFVKGPLIGWNAPKAMVSSMGALTMPQFVISAAIGGGDSATLKPSGTTPAGNLVIPPEECRRAIEKLLGEEPPRQPNCPQG